MDEMIPRDTAKLWGEVHTLRGVVENIKTYFEGKAREIDIHLMGADGSNGIRGNLKKLADENHASHEMIMQGHIKLEERLDDVDRDVQESKAWGRRLWEVERHQPGGCIGADKVKELEDKLERERKDTREREDILISERRRERKETRALIYTLIGGIVVSIITSLPDLIGVVAGLQAAAPKH